MIKRLVVLVAILALTAGLATAELRYTKLSSTTASGTTTINAGTLLVINDGASSIYVRVFWEGETAGDATASNTEIKTGESMTFSKTTAVSAISVVSASSSTVRLVYW